MNIKDYAQMMKYLTRPASSMVPGPRNMYNQGQLVTPSVDGSRPGYAGKGYSWSEDRGAWRIFLKRGDEQIAGYVYPKDFGGSKKKAEQSVIKKLNKWKTDNPAMETRPTRSADVIDDYKLSNWLKKNKDFDFANSTVEDVMKKSKTNLSKSVVTKYLRNLGLTNPKFEPLPKEIQKEIKFKYANDYKGTWNFDTHKYGFPGTGGGDKQTRTYNNIRVFVNQPKAWRYGGAGLNTPEGWMVAQMDRAWRNGNKNYKPIYRTINNQKKIVGFIDNSEAGGGKKYISAIEFIKGSDADGILFTEHDDYANTKKFNDVARKVHGSPSKVITDILSEGGVEMFTETGKAKVQLKHVLNYLIDTKGLDKTITGMVRHHKGGAYGSPTSDYQILNKVINSKISGIEGRIRADQILPEDIAKLKKWGASVTHKGKTYGGGPKTAIGGLREIEKFILKGSKDVELYGKEIKGIEQWKKTDFNKFKTYLKQLCSRGKASGGRIGFAEGPATVACGEKRLNEILFKGGGTGKEKNLVQKIISGGGRMALTMLNPKELLRLSNIVGPAALGIMAAYEAGSITDDVLRLGKPLNEALAGNWLTKSFMPFSEEFAKQKNLLQSGKLTGNQREYALEMMKMENFIKEGKRIEGMEATRLVDQGGYGKIDGSSMVSEKDMNEAWSNLFGKLIRMKPYMFEQGVTGRSLENEAAMNEYIDMQTAKTGEYIPEVSEDKFRLDGQRKIKRDEDYDFASKSIWWKPNRLVNKADRPKNMTRGPMTEKGKMDLDYHIPGYTPYDKAYTPSDEEVLQIYRNIGVVPPTTGYLAPGEGTKFRMNQAMQGGNRSIFGTKFSEGGITTLRSKYEYKR